MAVTQISDAYVHDVYLSYFGVNDVERSAFVESGAVVTSPLFDNAARGGGKMITVPFWNDLDPTIEPNMSNDDPADLAVPNKIGSDTMTARNSWLNQGWSAMDLVKELAGSNPMERIRARFATYWTRQFDRRVIRIALGVLADSVASHSSDMLIGDGTTVFQPAMVIDAATQFGDSEFEFGAIAVHPEIAGTMAKNDDIITIPDSEGNLTIETYKGLRVIKSLGLAVANTGAGDDTVYTSILFGAGGVGFGGADGSAPFVSGSGTPLVPSEVERTPRAGNGGGQETLWERKTWMIHPLGYDWANDGTLTEFSPTLADLDDAAHWDRVVNRVLVPLAFIKAKASPKTYT